MNPKSLIILITLTSLACNPRDSETIQATDLAEQDIEKIKELERLADNDLVTKDANGDVSDLKGFKPTKNFDESNNRSDQDLRESYANNESMFDFEAPEGVEVEFSVPNMITGSSLFLTNKLKAKCGSLS